jgi:hypothetical protein
MKRLCLLIVTFLSYDEGKTWPVKRVLCEESFAYSCLYEARKT